MIGTKAGDVVTWRRPSGDTEVEIVEIRYPRS
jgi:transcription elongation GreA/GreB family factor